MLTFITSRLVSDAKQAWRWASMRLMAAAAGLDGLSEAVKQGWIGLPDDLKSTLPSYASKAVGILILAAIIGRLYKQKPPAAGGQ